MRHITRSVFALTLALGAAAAIGAPSTADAQRSRDRDRDRGRNDDDRGGEQHTGEPFRWNGDVQSGRWVYLHNLNGQVHVEAGTGRKLEVTAVKRWRRGDPQDVDVTVKQVGSGNGDVLICAVWKANETRCDEDGYSSRSSNDGWARRNNDTSVEFTIRLPAGVKIDASTVNGEMVIDGATSNVIARTVNGGVEARSSGGPVRAKTVNGDVTVHTGAIEDGSTEYSTVNGSITVDIPATTNADLDMRTTNGNVSSDFPLTVQGTFSTKHVRATLGKGGATIRLSTVNGSIRLRKA